MTVKELIAELQKIDNQDLPVYRWDREGDTYLVESIGQDGNCVIIDIQEYGA